MRRTYDYTHYTHLPESHLYKTEEATCNSVQDNGIDAKKIMKL